MTAPAETEQEEGLQREPLRVLFAGTPSNAARALQLLCEQLGESSEKVALVGVLTREDAPVGRKRVLTPSPVAQAAEQLGLPVIKANRVSAEAIDRIRSLRADAAAVVAYGAMLRTDALEALPLGWFNLHYSLLPDLRGAAPVQRAIMGGRERTGATVFRIDEGLDTGAIASSVEIDVPPLATSGELLEQLTELGARELAFFFGRLAADPALAAAGAPQLDGDYDYAHKLTAEDSRLDLSWTVETASRVARGTLPAPGPWLRFQDQKFKILSVIGSEPADESGSAADLLPGRISARGKGIAIDFADGRLVTDSVQPFGKKPMNAADWLRGVQNAPAQNSSTERPSTELRFTS